MIRWSLICPLSLIMLLAACDKSVDKPAVTPHELSASPAERLALTEKCSKDGMAFFVRYRSANLPDNYFWAEPEFHYSAKRNTCLLYARFVSNPSSPLRTSTWHMNAVIDIFANKVILQGNFERMPDGLEKTTEATMSSAPNFTSAEFFKRKEALFSE